MKKHSPLLPFGKGGGQKYQNWPIFFRQVIHEIILYNSAAILSMGRQVQYTVYSRYILVEYIAELDISRSYVGPHFLAHRKFCRRGAQERNIFCEITVTPCIQSVGDNFSQNLLTTKAFVPVCRSQFFAKSTQAYLSMRAGAHAVRWAATLGGALTPPLCRRVGFS